VSVLERAPGGTAPDDVDGLGVIMRSGGRPLRERMHGVERHLEHLTAQAGGRHARFANATATSGGKRPTAARCLRPSRRRTQQTPEGEERQPRAAVCFRALGDARARRSDHGLQVAPIHRCGPGRRPSRRDLLFSRVSPSSPATGFAQLRALWTRARRSPRASCCSAKTPTTRASRSSATSSAAR
jgi:hypothetical protein